MSTVANILDSISKLQEALDPVADIVGLGKVSDLVAGAVDIAELLINNINETQEVLNSSDSAEIAAKLASIKARNDALAERIRNS